VPVGTGLARAARSLNRNLPTLPTYLTPVPSIITRYIGGDYCWIYFLFSIFCLRFLILGGFNGDSMWSEWGDNEDENETEGSWMDEADDVRAFEEVKWHFFFGWIGISILLRVHSFSFISDIK
jgi:hypothetical protein